jgi:hypothetical protein
MKFSRRLFLAGAAGLAAQAFYQRALDYVLTNEEPLLLPPTRASINIYADNITGDSYWLFHGAPWGHPDGDPSEVIVKEFVDRFCDGDYAEYSTHFEHAPALTDRINWCIAYHDETWASCQDPAKLAYRLVEPLELGNDFTHENGAGEILFEPFHELAIVPNDLSLSLLQRRLNDLDSGVRLILSIGATLCRGRVDPSSGPIPSYTKTRL